MYKLSIIIITLHRNEMLEKSINAILKNDCTNYELIVVDQSTDNKTKELIVCYQKTYPHIRYIHCESKGAGHARNFGVQHAKGKIIAFADDDCIAEKELENKRIIEGYEKWYSQLSKRK